MTHARIVDKGKDRIGCHLQGFFPKPTYWMVIQWTPICGRRSHGEPEGLFEQLSEFSTVKGLYPQILDSYPQDTPCGLPQDTPCGLPQDTPCGLPQDTPCGLPQDTPCGLPQDDTHRKTYTKVWRAYIGSDPIVIPQIREFL
jgi:hypothetical protein